MKKDLVGVVGVGALDLLAAKGIDVNKYVTDQGHIDVKNFINDLQSYGIFTEQESNSLETPFNI